MKIVLKTRCLAVGLFLGLMFFTPARAAYYNYCNIGAQAYPSVPLTIPVGCPGTAIYASSNFASDQTWLTPQMLYNGTPTNSTITFAIEANTGANSRLARFTGKINGTDIKLDFIQAGTAAITPVKKQVPVTADAQTATCVVQMAAAPFTQGYEANPTGWVRGKDITITTHGTDPRWCQVTVNMPENDTGSSRTVTVSMYRDSGSQLIGTVEFTQAAKDAEPTSDFGPGNLSTFYLSESEKAFVFGVYNLDWSDFPVRSSDGFHVYENAQLVDRDKGTGSNAADHTKCWEWAWLDAVVWTGWSKKAGFKDEDEFAKAVLSSSSADSVDYLYDHTGINLVENGSAQVDELNSTFAAQLATRFAKADTMAILCVEFPNYNWYGTVGVVHSVACCGYSVDTTKNLSDAGALKGLFIIDPDNDRDTNGGGASAPDTITYCPVSWDAAAKTYKISNVFGTTGTLEPSVYFLSAEKSVPLRQSDKPYQPPVYTDAKNVTAQAGTVEFVLSLPDGNTYAWDTNEFKFSAPWLTLAKSPSRNGHTVYLTFSYEANTGTAARDAVFTATIDNTAVTLTVSQAVPPPTPPKEYSDVKSVTAQAGTVEFVLSLPDGNTYAWDTNEFKFSAPWLTLAKSPSRNGHTVYLTFSYEANAGTAARDAVFTATIDNAAVTLTVSQAGAPEPEPVPNPVPNPSPNPNPGDQTDARLHDFGTLTEEVGKIMASTFETPTKARTYNGVVRDEFDNPAGVITVSVGKANKAGQFSVKASVTGLDGKKKSSNVVKAQVPESGAVRVNLSVKDYGALEIALDTNSIAGTLGKYEVLSAQFGIESGTTRACFNLEDFDWTDSTTLLDEYLPYDEEFSVNGKRWTFDKAAVIKYKKGEFDEESYEKGLDGGKTNVSGLKLTYNARSCTFKGGFTVYSEDNRGTTPKLKKTRATVTGVMVDGYGYGQAVVRKGATFPASISPVQ